MFELNPPPLFFPNSVKTKIDILGNLIGFIRYDIPYEIYNINENGVCWPFNVP